MSKTKQGLRGRRSSGVSDKKVEFPRTIVGEAQRQRDKEERERVAREAAELEAQKAQVIADAEQKRKLRDEKAAEEAEQYANQRAASMTTAAAAAARSVARFGFAAAAASDNIGSALRSLSPMSEEMRSRPMQRPLNRNALRQQVINPDPDELSWDEALHRRFAAGGTVTGRMSSASPDPSFGGRARPVDAHLAALGQSLHRHLNNLYGQNSEGVRVINHPGLNVVLERHDPGRMDTDMEAGIQIAPEALQDAAFDVANQVALALTRQVADLHRLDHVQAFVEPPDVLVEEDVRTRSYHATTRPPYTYVVLKGYGGKQALLQEAAGRAIGELRGTAVATAQRAYQSLLMQDDFTISLGDHEHWVAVMRATQRDEPTHVVLLSPDAENVMQSRHLVGSMTLETALGQFLLFLKDHYSRS